MKRFHFPLDRVLRYREMLADTEAARLERCLAEVWSAEARLQALDAAAASTDDEVRQSFAATREIEPGHLVTYPDYRFLRARQRDALVSQHQQAVAAAECQRLVLVEARRACEVLSRAREMAWERWKTEYQRDQEATASELFLSGWSRRRLPPPPG